MGISPYVSVFSTVEVSSVSIGKSRFTSELKTKTK